MPLSQDDQLSLDRLLNFYNGDLPYDPVTNPGGFRNGGHRILFDRALRDVARATKASGKALDAMAGMVLSTADPAFAGGSKADCTAQGVGTDLAPCVRAALDYGVTNLKHGFKIEVPNGPHRWATGTTLDGRGARHVTIDLGVITLDAVAMRAVKFVNFLNLRVIAKLDRGGRYDAGSNNLYADYRFVEDVVSVGGQEALVFNQVFDCDLDITAYGYCGRAVRITHSGIQGLPGTGAFKGRIATKRNEDLSQPRTFQSLWADPGNDVGRGNFGNLDLLNNDFDVYPPIFRDWNDIKINEIDAAYHASGPEFRGCGVITLPSVYIGAMDKGDPNAFHLVFGPSSSRNSSGVSLGVVKLLTNGGGILLDRVAVNSDLGTVYSYSNDTQKHGTVLDIRDCQNVYGRVVVDNDGSAVVNLQGATTVNVNLDLKILAIHKTNPVLIQEEVKGPINLTGEIAGVGASFTAIIVAAHCPVILSKLHIKKGDGFHLWCVQSDNKVIWESGSFDGAAVSYPQGYVAKYVNPNMVVSQ